MKNEIFHIDEQGYNDLPALRSTLLKEFMKSPAHYRYMRDAPHSDASYFILGSFVHSLILEPETVKEKYLCAKVKSRNAKEYKEMVPRAKAQKKDILLQPEWQKGVEMANEAMKDPHFAAMLQKSEAELSATAKIEDVWVKVRLDMYIPDTGVIVDIKTTSESSKYFPYNLRKYGYDVSAALYWDAFEQAGEKINGFYFAVIEKFPPYGIKLFKLSEEYIEEGRAKCRYALQDYKKCLAGNVWQGYNNAVPEIILPPSLGTKPGGKQNVNQEGD